MALTPIIAHRKQLAAKIEAEHGTAESLTGADAVDIVINPEFEDITEKERERRNLDGWHPGVLGVRLGRITFEKELSSGAANPGWALKYLAACGLGYATGAFRRDPRHPLVAASTQQTLTMGFYQDGVFHRLHGAMGNCVISGEAGKVVRARFSFTGKYVKPSDVALLAPTYETPALLRLNDAACAIGAMAPKISRFELDLGNEVEAFLDASHEDGVAHFMIADAATRLKMDPIMALAAEQDVYALFDESAESAISIACTNGSDTATIAMTKGEVVELKRQERNKLVAWDLSLGDNAADLSITFATGS